MREAFTCTCNITIILVFRNLLIHVYTNQVDILTLSISIPNCNTYGAFKSRVNGSHNLNPDIMR